MTDEEIRVKIALSIGWTPEEVQNEDGHGQRFGHTLRWRKPGDTRIAHYLLAMPSNYPEDLNACAEFEARMVTGERVAYREHLVQICDSYFHAGTHWSSCSVHANARQRCLAYLKTKGLLP